MERDERNQQCERDGDDRNQRGAEIHQEEEEHQYHEDAALNQGVAHVAYGVFDKAGLAVDVGLDFYVAGQGSLHFCQGAVQRLGQFDGPCAGLFCYGQYDGFASVLCGRSGAWQAVAHPDFGHRFQGDGSVGRSSHQRLAQVVDAVGTQDGTNQVFVAVFVEYAARSVAVESLDGGCDFPEADFVVTHAFGAEQYLVLLDVAAQHGHLCHAAGA